MPFSFLDLPGKPKNFTVIMERQESPSVTFSWTSPVELPGQPLEGYFLELRIEGSTGDVLTVCAIDKCIIL